jgi:cell division cycle 20-like protein 1 (cofactor of APC complex)
MAWNSNVLATGSRDKSILQRDLRIARDFVIQMKDHTQEICGIKWSID